MEGFSTDLVMWVRDFIHVVLHVDQYLAAWSQSMGPLLYVLLFCIIFSETGLVVLPFLPGDSLLFAAGALAALAGSGLDITLLLVLLTVAAILGDFVNYHVGKFFGPRVFRERKKFRWLNPEHLKYTQSFYEKYGGKTVILARFIPIARTFAPFIAGIGSMRYGKFVLFNIVGALAWVVSCLMAGYLLGNIPIVKRNFHIVIFAIIIISVLPAFFEWYRGMKRTRHA